MDPGNDQLATLRYEDRFSEVAAQIMSFIVNVFFFCVFFKLPVKNYVNAPI